MPGHLHVDKCVLFTFAPLIYVPGHDLNLNASLNLIYRSPDSQLSMFNESLENILIQIDNEKCIAYLSGDFNVNTAEVLNCKSQTIQDFINIYSSFHYHKLINQPTRIILHKYSIKTATLIDNIYTNSTNLGNQYKWNLTFRSHHRN